MDFLGRNTITLPAFYSEDMPSPTSNVDRVVWLNFDRLRASFYSVTTISRTLTLASITFT